MLLQALRDILQRPSIQTGVLETTVQILKQAESPPILQNFGPAAQWTAFFHRLEAAGDDNDNDDNDDDDGDLIAITGFSGRFLGAESCEDLWDLLCDGLIVSGEMPLERVADGFGGPLPQGCFIEKAGQFDASFFDMSRHVARQTDPAHQLLLHVTQESLGMAGYMATGSGTTCHVGTFVGQATDDWREHNMDPLDAYYMTGGLRAFGRLNHFFGWDGPSLSVDTACSSSGMALDLAVQALRGRKCDMAVAGGVSIVTGGADVGICAGLGSGGLLGVPCTGTACKTFGAAAEGYRRGEAVAVVVPERLSDARRCRDVVHGVIRGVATHHSTGTSPNITRPSVAAQVSLLRQFRHESLRLPADFSYVDIMARGRRRATAPRWRPFQLSSAAVIIDNMMTGGGPTTTFGLAASRPV
ncbi:hypothetical protein QIS74_08538 [Colletotrichum tabaci]|uniref:Ketosynthase family 3 (KS3) domain-containing protein n=1 Tax=Colletotrichum tabaci TaxID=1209068 RepID=A0AAV9TBW1_9PEZI